MCLLTWENDGCNASHSAQIEEAHSVKPVSRVIDRIEVRFDDPSLVANAGLLLVGTLAVRLELERLVNTTVRLVGRAGGAQPGRKALTLVHAMVAGASHIDHADVLRAGNTAGVLPLPGDGAFDVGHVLAGLQFRSCPPARSRGRRGAEPGVGAWRRAGLGPAGDRHRLDHL